MMLLMVVVMGVSWKTPWSVRGCWDQSSEISVKENVKNFLSFRQAMNILILDG